MCGPRSTTGRVQIRSVLVWVRFLSLLECLLDCPSFGWIRPPPKPKVRFARTPQRRNTTARGRARCPLTHEHNRGPVSPAPRSSLLPESDRVDSMEADDYILCLSNIIRAHEWRGTVVGGWVGEWVGRGLGLRPGLGLGPRQRTPSVVITESTGPASERDGLLSEVLFACT